MKVSNQTQQPFSRALIAEAKATESTTIRRLGILALGLPKGSYVVLYEVCYVLGKRSKYAVRKETT